MNEQWMQQLEHGRNKMLTENEVKRRINAICNGGHGSGNPNPGQGRGKGKPGSGAGVGMKTRDIKGKTRLGKIATVKPGDTVEIEPADNLPNFDKKIKVDEVGDDYFRYGITEYSYGKDYPFYAIKDIKKISYEDKKNSDPISVPMSKRKRIEYDDDVVAVYKGDEEIYKGIEDDEPMKREPWKYDDSTKTYSIPEHEQYKKVCIDM